MTEHRENDAPSPAGEGAQHLYSPCSACPERSGGSEAGGEVENR
jgi:hypothetical protein